MDWNGFKQKKIDLAQKKLKKTRNIIKVTNCMNMKRKLRKSERISAKTTDWKEEK
jgi:hypothetical protein